MQLGVCYYPEHWPPERWPVDAALMRRAGLTLVRIGEFAWAQMEPADGRFEWDWLDRAIGCLADVGLRIVLGTPTATPPAWLCTAHPEILPVDAEGRRLRFGSRRHYCSNSPVYAQYTDRIVRVLAERYGGHPAVMGWQIDNELGCHNTARCYCEVCEAAFRTWLRQRYGALDALNEAWGTAFWSQHYGAWEEINPPNLTVTEPNPSQALDYYRFSSDSVIAFQQRQIDALRASVPAGHFITTNLMGEFHDLDYHALAQPLGFVTWDSYPTGYAEMGANALYAPGEPRPQLAYDLGDPDVTGFCHQLIAGCKPGVPFWIMEQQSGHINWAPINPGVGPGAVRLWTWHALAAGAEAVVYFRWRAVRLAQEQHHSGLLKHDAQPDQGLREVQRLHAERERLSQVAAHPPTPAVALLFSYADVWAISQQPHRRDFSLLRHLFVYYRALQRLGLPVAIVGPTADLSPYRVVIAPTLFLGTAGQAQGLTEHARAGASVLLGVRSGFKTPTNLVIDQPLPGVFRDLVGATVTTWQSLPDDVGFALASDLPGLAGEAQVWAELLDDLAPNTVALAHYAAGPLAGGAALTQRPVGAGQAYYLGFYPSVDQAQAVAAHLAQEAGLSLGQVPAGLVALPRGPLTVWLNFTDKLLSGTSGAQAVSVPPREVVVSGPASV